MRIDQPDEDDGRADDPDTPDANEAPDTSAVASFCDSTDSGDALGPDQHNCSGRSQTGGPPPASTSPAPGSDATVTTPLRLGLDNAESTTGWALTDSAAAVAYGAPLVVRAEQLLDFYVLRDLIDDGHNFDAKLVNVSYQRP